MSRAQITQQMKVLIAYDGSKYADAALHDLKRAGLGSEVDAVVMTLADVFVPPPIDETFPTYVPEGVQRAHERAQQKLEEARGLAKLLGSISSAVSARAHCSVEVVRPNLDTVRVATFEQSFMEPPFPETA